MGPIYFKIRTHVYVPVVLLKTVKENSNSQSYKEKQLQLVIN